MGQKYCFNLVILGNNIIKFWETQSFLNSTIFHPKPNLSFKTVNFGHNIVYLDTEKAVTCTNPPKISTQGYKLQACRMRSGQRRTQTGNRADFRWMRWAQALTSLTLLSGFSPPKICGGERELRNFSLESERTTRYLSYQPASKMKCLAILRLGLLFCAISSTKQGKWVTSHNSTFSEGFVLLVLFCNCLLNTHPRA